jgi:hypothetical protein
MPGRDLPWTDTTGPAPVLCPVLCVGAVDPLVGVSVLIGCSVPLEMFKREPEVSTNSALVKPVPFTAGFYATEPTKVLNRVAAGGFGWTSHGSRSLFWMAAPCVFSPM